MVKEQTAKIEALGEAIRSTKSPRQQDMDFEDNTEQDEGIVIISDPEDEMGVDEIFKSIIETGSVRKDNRPSAKIESTQAVEMCKVTDIDEVRLLLPSINDFQLKPAMIWKLIKDMIGKDLTKLELPCFVNEPSTILQRQAECCFYTDGFVKASQQDTSCLRMVYVTSTFLSFMMQCVYRIKKPFNPLLGETYELVTPKFRFYSEQVSHHPPIMSMVCEGQNFEMQYTAGGVIKFTGKCVLCTDPHKRVIVLTLNDGSKETYVCDSPNLLCGNLFFGETFVEPH